MFYIQLYACQTPSVTQEARLREKNKSEESKVKKKSCPFLLFLVTLMGILEAWKPKIQLLYRLFCPFFFFFFNFMLDSPDLIQQAFFHFLIALCISPILHYMTARQLNLGYTLVQENSEVFKWVLQIGPNQGRKVKLASENKGGKTAPLLGVSTQQFINSLESVQHKICCTEEQLLCIVATSLIAINVTNQSDFLA